jgi:lycopene beta-cyclase
MLPAEAFYAEALQVLAQSGRIELMTGASVISEPDKSGENWQIETSAGLHRGKMVIDTRPVRNFRQSEAMLWQSFSGHEIECDAAVFDPTCTDLMDFSLGDPTRIAFSYVLPVSRNRALVEATVFGTDPIDCDGLAQDLDIGIARRVNGATFKILRSENGILPMGFAPQARRSDNSYVEAGLTSGGARPSTGYAFQRIQRWADACAKRIGEGRLPMGHAADPLPLRAMDHLFLSVLRARPESAPSLFLSLFEKTDTARVIRFLSDRGTLLDLAIVASALPVLPFIQEIPSALMKFAQLRRGVLSQ